MERSDVVFLTDGEGVGKNELRMSLSELRMSLNELRMSLNEFCVFVGRVMSAGNRQSRFCCEGV